MIKKNEIKFSSNERGGFNGESFYTHVIFFFLSLSSSFLDNKNKKKMAPRSSGEGAAVFFFLFLMDDVIMGSRDNTISKGGEIREPPSLRYELKRRPPLSLYIYLPPTFWVIIIIIIMARSYMRWWKHNTIHLSSAVDFFTLFFLV